MDWKAFGNCVGEDPDLFFPEPNRYAELKAKKVCEGCLVRAQCLDVALAFNDVGIWGGTTEKERKRIKDRYVRGANRLAGQHLAV